MTHDIVIQALAEDLGPDGDITSAAVIPQGTQASVVMAARETGVASGIDLAVETFRHVDATLEITQYKKDGDALAPGDRLLTVTGNARSILAAERVALNFVGRLSGIATLTRRMVDAVGPHKAKICDTRKTTPTLRALEKHAVRCGGGTSHRSGLYDMILIKDNHIAIAGGVVPAMRAAKQAGRNVKIEIEVDTLTQFREALAEEPDIVLLDNMSLADMAEAVKSAAGKCQLEASGGVTLARIPLIAATGVDRISSGALTHSAPNLDVGLDFLQAAEKNAAAA